MGELQIFAPVRATAQVGRISSEYRLVCGGATQAPKRTEVLLGFPEGRFARKPIIRRQAIVNSPIEQILLFQERRASAPPLELARNLSPCTKVRPNFISLPSG